MPGGYRHIDRRKAHGQDRRKKAQKAGEGGNLKPVVPVVAGLEEAVVIRRENKHGGRMIRHQYYPSLQHRRGRPVRALCRLELRKGRQPVLFRKLLQHPAVQDSVNLIGIHPLPNGMKQIRIDQILHVDQRRHGVRSGPDLLLLHLHPGIPQTLPDQRHIELLALCKAFSGTAHDLFALCFGYSKPRIPFAGDLIDLIVPFQKQDSVPCKKSRLRLFVAGQGLDVRQSDDMLLQHQIADRHLHIDQQPLSFPVVQKNLPVQDIIAFFKPLLYPSAVL